MVSDTRLRPRSAAVARWLSSALVCGAACAPAPAPVREPSAAPAKPEVAAVPSERAAAPTPPATSTVGPAVLESGRGAAPVKLGFAALQRGERLPWEAQAVREESEPVAHAWRLERTLRVGIGYLYRALPTPDETGVVTLSTQDGGLRYYDRKSGELRRRIDLPAYREFEDADFAIVGERPLRVLVQRESGVVSYDLEGSAAPRELDLPAGDRLQATAFPGLYGFTRREIPSQTGSLSLRWLAEDGTSTRAFELMMSERPDGWALSTDGRLLAVSYYPSNLTQLLDLEQGVLRASIQAPEWGSSVALSPGGNYLALGGAHLALHARADGRLLTTSKAFGNNISDVRFTPRGDLLLVSAYDGKVRSYALPPGDQPPEQLTAPQILRHGGAANVYALGLSADGRLLVTPSGDKTVKLWVR